ncbi:hypothetical protein D9M68_709040 [compost metagenome]
MSTDDAFLLLKYKILMGKKIALNVFYNLVLFFSVIGMAWAYKNNSPLISIFLLAVFVAVLYFKVQLVKNFRK